MINLSQMVHEVEKLPPEQRQAVANLIDLKTENDVERILNKLDAVGARIDALETKFDAIETKFDTKIDALDATVNARIDAIETKFDNKFQSLYWVLAVSSGFIVSFVTLAFTVATFLFKQ